MSMSMRSSLGSRKRTTQAKPHPPQRQIRRQHRVRLKTGNRLAAMRTLTVISAVTAPAPTLRHANPTGVTCRPSRPAPRRLNA
jgi:hypothetical protein